MPQTFGHYRSLAVALGKSGGFDLWAYFAAAARHHALIAASPVTAHPSSQNHGAGREAAVNGCGVVGILRLKEISTGFGILGSMAPYAIQFRSPVRVYI